MDPPAHIAVTADHVTLLIHQVHGASLYLERYELPASTMRAAWREMVQLPNIATLLELHPVTITADTIMDHLQVLQQHTVTSDITEALEMFLPRVLLYYMYSKITGNAVVHQIFKPVAPATPRGDGHSTIHDDVLTVVSEYCDANTAFRLHIAHPMVVLPEYHILAGLYDRLFLEQCLCDYHTWSPLLFDMMTKLVDEFIIERDAHNFKCKSWPVPWLGLLLAKATRVDPHSNTIEHLNPELRAYLGPHLFDLERWPNTLTWQDMFMACDNLEYLYQYATRGVVDLAMIYNDYMEEFFPFPQPDDDDDDDNDWLIGYGINFLFHTESYEYRDIPSYDELVQKYDDVIARYHQCDVHGINPFTDADIMARYQEWRRRLSDDAERVMSKITAKITTRALEQYDTLSEGIIVYTDTGVYRYWSELWLPCCWYVACKVDNLLSVKRGSLTRHLILSYSAHVDKSITLADALAVVRYHIL